QPSTVQINTIVAWRNIIFLRIKSLLLVDYQL
ncbi:MAG: hypothetical protein ACI9LY_003542, partial [Arenicella sp.]